MIIRTELQALINLEDDASDVPQAVDGLMVPAQSELGIQEYLAPQADLAEAKGERIAREERRRRLQCECRVTPMRDRAVVVMGAVSTRDPLALNRADWVCFRDGIAVDLLPELAWQVGDGIPGCVYGFALSHGSKEIHIPQWVSSDGELCVENSGVRV